MEEGISFFTFKAASACVTLAPRRRLTAESKLLSQHMRWDRMHPHTCAFILTSFSTLLFNPRDFFSRRSGMLFLFI